METLFDTTITDKPIFSAKIIDTVKYNTLTDQEKIIFETLRNSLLEIMPLQSNSNEFSIEALRYAENYAFINMKVFSKTIIDIINEKIFQLEQTINTRINTLQTPTTG